MIIISLLSKRDAFSLSLACHDLHSFALRRALSSIKLSAEKPERPASCCLFMLAHIPKRPHRVRRLHIKGGVSCLRSEGTLQGFSPTQLFAEPLRHASNLVHLRVDMHSEFTTNPVATDAMVSLRNLVSLELRLFVLGPSAFDVLGRMLGLRRLTVIFYSFRPAAAGLFLVIPPLRSLRVLYYGPHSHLPRTRTFSLARSQTCRTSGPQSTPFR